jgi:pimeloyl-ACP methyl ester carboxylesterase
LLPVGGMAQKYVKNPACLAPLSTARSPARKASHSQTRRPKHAGRGARAEREPLVLLHPFALCSQVWTPVLPFLQSYHEVHTLSVPGHHGSDPLPTDYRHSINGALDLLERKLDALGIERAHTVGNSLGGWLAVELARRGRSLSVVAFAPGGGWELGSPEHMRVVRRFQRTRRLLSLGAHMALRLSESSLGRALCLHQAVAHPERLSPEQARLLIERVWRCEVYNDLLEVLHTQAVPEPIDVLPCPIKLVWGDQDRVLPREIYAQRWRRVLPAADWELLKDVGHLPMFDAPREVAECILVLSCPAAVPRLARGSLAG